MQNTDQIQTPETKLLHCQNCQNYARNPSDLKPYGGFISCCRTCRVKLDAKALAKSQISFDFAGDQTMFKF